MRPDEQPIDTIEAVASTLRGDIERSRDGLLEHEALDRAARELRNRLQRVEGERNALRDLVGHLRHELVTTNGLYAHDGQPEDSPAEFQLDFEASIQRIDDLLADLESTG